MKYRLKIFRPSVQTNAYGEDVPTFEYMRTIWAERVKQTGWRNDKAGEHFTDYTVTFRIRDAHPVKENWRVEQQGGYIYTVATIIPNIDRGMLEIECKRLND